MGSVRIFINRGTQFVFVCVHHRVQKRGERDSLNVQYTVFVNRGVRVCHHLYKPWIFARRRIISPSVVATGSTGYSVAGSSPTEDGGILWVIKIPSLHFLRRGSTADGPMSEMLCWPNFLTCFSPVIFSCFVTRWQQVGHLLLNQAETVLTATCARQGSSATE
jgi:hypothetical protein